MIFYLWFICTIVYEVLILFFFVREGLYVLVCALLYMKCLEYRIAYMVLLIWNCFYAEFHLCVIVDKVLHMGYCVIRIEYIVLWTCYFYFVIFMLSIKNIWYRVWVFHVYIYTYVYQWFVFAI